MKIKTFILIIITLIILSLVKIKNDKLTIPQEAIRIRIVANSDSSIDIKEKIKVKEKVEKEIYSLIKDAKNIDEARNIINTNLENLDVVISDTTDLNYDFSFGPNYFPRKVYKGVIYDEGIYESLVITLGDGVGDNWWCVLFPPLCLLDENEYTDDVEYAFYVEELIKKYQDKSS